MRFMSFIFIEQINMSLENLGYERKNKMTTQTKQKATHTPAPWSIGVRQPNSDKFIYGSKGEEIANCDRLTNFPEENLANAQLIASAPELLEALYIALPFVEDGLFHEEYKKESVKECIKRIRSAIEKAEGKS